MHSSEHHSELLSRIYELTQQPIKTVHLAERIADSERGLSVINAFTDVIKPLSESGQLEFVDIGEYEVGGKVYPEKGLIWRQGPEGNEALPVDYRSSDPCQR